MTTQGERYGEGALIVYEIDRLPFPDPYPSHIYVKSSMEQRHARCGSSSGRN